MTRPAVRDVATRAGAVVVVAGSLAVPGSAAGLIVFAYSSGSSRSSPLGACRKSGDTYQFPRKVRAFLT